MSDVALDFKINGLEKLDQLDAKVKKVKNEAKTPAKVNIDTAQAENSLNSLDTKVKKTSNGMSGIKTAGGVALAGLSALVVKGAGEMLSYASSIEQTNATWKTLAGSEAPAILQKIKDIAAKTPFELAEVNKSFQALYNAGLRGDKLEKMFMTVGDAAGAVGAPVEQVTRAMSQMLAKGKVTGEEMLQLTDAGIPGWKLLAESMGLTVAEVQDLSAKGKLGEESLIALQNGMDKAFGGGMQVQSETLNGKLSTMSDTIKNSLEPVFTSLIDKIKPVVDWITNFASANPVLFGTIIVVVGALILLSGIMMLMIPIATGFGISMGMAFIWVFAIIAAIILIVLLIQNWGAIMNWLGEQWKKVGEWFSKGWEDTKKMFSAAGQWFWDNVINPVIEAFKSIPGAVSGFFKSAWDGIVNMFSNLGNALKDAFAYALDQLPFGIGKPIKAFLGLYDELETFNQHTLTISDIARLNAGTTITYNNQKTFNISGGVIDKRERKRLVVDLKKVF